MGSWGPGIRQDDLVRDVIESFKEQLKDGAPIGEATEKVEREYAETLDDEDEAPLVRLALADAQWTYGALDPQLYARVRADVEAGAGLGRWQEASAEDFEKRRLALAKFLEKTAQPNPRPAKLPRRVVRPPRFEAGDCLAVALSNGQYGAALVLATDPSEIEYGKNLIAVLDYMAAERPPIKVFTKRRWLEMTHHEWGGELDISWYLAVGFQGEKERFERVGKIRLRRRDPKDALSYTSWDELGEQVVRQRAWDRGEG
jgi:hypothetical protein